MSAVLLLVLMHCCEHVSVTETKQLTKQTKKEKAE